MRQAANRLAAEYPNKRAIITGAASGLGLAFAKRLAAAGWTLGLMDRNAVELASVKHTLASVDQTVYTYHVNVADAHGVSGAIERFAQVEHGLDLLINNAGVAVGGDFLTTSLDDWRWIVDINLMGVLHGCRAALPHMKSANLGCIVNIASAAGFVCGPGMSAYNVTKAGVVALSESLMQESVGTGVRVAVAMPGFFQTNLLDGARGTSAAAHIVRKLMASSSVTADDVAEIVLAAAARRQTHIIVPREYLKLWRWKRCFPSHFVRTFPKMAARRR